MGFFKPWCYCFVPLLHFFIVGFLAFQCYADDSKQTSILVVNATNGSGRKISETFFGIFFEEINHAGAGGLWAELVNNRGFEAGGQNTPSDIAPWTIIGGDSTILVSTEPASCFPNNIIALRMDVLCGTFYHPCPAAGVGISNPGFWGMNIEQGKKYRVIFYVRSRWPIHLVVSFVGSNDATTLAKAHILRRGSPAWERIETLLEARATDRYASLQITSLLKGTIWLDQVSAMPLDTYRGHGFRKDLFQMMADLKPRFLRFPGGNFVEGDYLRNAFRWKASIGPWENRAGHFGFWGYWTDEGLGYYECLQLAEDLGVLPVWVFNIGISRQEQVNTSAILPFVQEAIDGIEFAVAAPNTKWGSVRAFMGHPEPYDLRYIALGNEDCGLPFYQGNYIMFYDAIRGAYPQIQIITNCDASDEPLQHPADLYDYHVYANATDMFTTQAQHFDNVSLSGPKAFVSEYAVWRDDAANGTLLAALGEAGFLVGLERNSDVVQMFSYAPLFVNTNDRRWLPDAIVFDSYRHYGTPSYWLQQIFSESSGATYLNSTLQTSSNDTLAASAIVWQNSADNQNYLKIKLVNIGSNATNVSISIEGLDSNVQLSKATKTLLTSSNATDENSFSEPNKIVPQHSSLENAGRKMNVTLPPHSFTSLDLLFEYQRDK